MENRVEPTCTVDGSYESVTYCSVCNAEVSRESKVINKLGHDYSNEWTVDIAPTCTIVGSKSYHCSRCDDKADITEIPANGHSWGNWYETEAPTCTTTGTDERECSVCHTKETRTTDALGHTNAIPVVENRVEPTCTVDGSYESVTYCSVCQAETGREAKVIAKLGHNYSTEWTIDIAPTCTTAGSMAHYCIRCNDKIDITEIPAIGHNFSAWETSIFPDCEVNGNAFRYCYNCNMTEQMPLDPLGHTNAIPVVENRVEPTCTVDGSYESVTYCSVCQAETGREAKVIAKLGHNYSTEWTIDIAPTCTTAGSMAHHCTRCDDKTDITEIPANGHDWGNWYETIAPTCTTTGTDERECSVCPAKEIRTPDALGHTNAIPVVENRVEPTCTVDGSYESVTYCSVCNAEVSRESKVINKLGHDYSIEWTVDVAPTCTAVGSMAHYCIRCNDKMDITEIPASGHNFSAWETSVFPDCEVNGNAFRYCYNCNMIEQMSLDPLGHTNAIPVVENRVEATCTTDGSYDSVAYCSVCQAEVSRESKTIAKLGHNEILHNGKSATCTESGWKEYVTCSRCDYSTYESIDALGHNEIHHAAQAPTCTEHGWDAYVTCTACNHTTYVELSANGHRSSNWIIDEEATFDKDGKKHKECTVCGEILEESIIPMLVHTYTVVVTSPTCTEQGYTTHTCSGCGNTYVDDYTPALGHSFGNWYENEAPTCTTTGTDERECSGCHTKETRTTDALGHTNVIPVVENKVDSTCTTDGSYDSVTYCAVCQAETGRESKVINKLGHDYANEWTVDIAPTCTTVGSKSHHCSRCDNQADITEIPANGHRWGNWYETEAPTCTATGTDERECSVCHTKETRTTDALGHTNAIPVVENKVDSTCTENGSYDSVTYCSVCKAEVGRESKVINKLGHDYSIEWTVDIAPACTTVGVQSHHCSRCDDKTDITEIPATGHKWSNWYETQAPTCTATGTDERECSVCHTKETRTIDALGHTNAIPVVENKVDSTCTENGSYDSVTYCLACQAEVSRKSQVINKLGHDYSIEWTVDVQPTCTTAGSQSRHCLRCDDQAYITEISATGHQKGSPVAENKVDSTCTENGSYDSVTYCLVCQAEVDRESMIINKLGHDYSIEWTIDTAPTCTTVGIQSHHCTRCDNKTSITEIPANGHTFGNWKQTKAPACTETGIERRVCVHCDHFEERKIDALGHNDISIVTPPTCTEQGYTTHRCTRCSEGDYLDSYVDALGHSFTNYVSNNDATYTEDGTKTSKCDRCDEMDTILDVGSAFGMAQKFRDEMAELNTNGNTETTYMELYAVLQTYSTLSYKEKAEVATEFATLQQMINAYNAKAETANNELAEATELAFAPIAVTSFAFLAALWFVLRKKFLV